MAIVVVGVAPAHAGISVTPTHTIGGDPAIDVFADFEPPEDFFGYFDIEAAYYAATVDRPAVPCAPRPDQQAASSTKLRFGLAEGSRYQPGRRLAGQQVRICAWGVVPSTGEDPNCTAQAAASGECVPAPEPDAIEAVDRLVRVPEPRPNWARRWRACGSPSNLVNVVRAYALPCSAARVLAGNVTFGRGRRVAEDFYGLPAFRCRTSVLEYEVSLTTCRVLHHVVRWYTTP